jgi:hypothetical protein
VFLAFADAHSLPPGCATQPTLVRECCFSGTE